MHSRPSNLTIISRDAAIYSAVLANKQLPGLNIITATESVENVDLNKIEILLTEPGIAAEILEQCHNLRWLQSTWAGNTPLLAMAKKDYVLTGAKGIFGAAMREYVFAYLLYFERNIETFKRKALPSQEGQSPNYWTQPSIGTLKSKRLGILGAGSIASDLVSAARLFEMEIVGINRSGKSETNYDALYTIDNLCEFASRLDYLVCILPDTKETRHIVDARFLEHLPKDCVLINAGRGNSIDDSALINALNKQQLKAAVLDVFKQEPLPNAHPYWHMENVYITQHTAAISSPYAVCEVFAENYTRWRNDQALKHSIDFTRGY